MKKLIVVIALIAAILLPSAINAQTQSSIGKGYYAVTTKIKVRTRPTTSSPVLEEVGPECDTFPFYFNRGDVVKVLENSGEWVKIAIYTETSNGNDYGFVMKKFLTVPDQLPDGWWKKSYSNPAYITMEGIEKRIIRKTKCSCDLERNVLKRKTKRYRNTLFPKIFSTGLRRFLSYAKTGSEHHSDPVLSFCRFAPALTLCAYATSVAALYAATLDALTRLPRKARREPTYVYVLEAS